MITGSETAHLSTKILPVFVDGRLPVLPGKDVLRLGLREDQVIRPTVAIRNEKLHLVLQGHAFQPPPNSHLTPGDTPAFKVHILPSGDALLRPVQTEPSAPLAPLVAPRIDRLMLHPPGMEALLNLLQPGTLKHLLAPNLVAHPEIATLMHALLRLRPSQKGISADSVRQSILNSGLFTETQLARGQAPQDNKTILLHLLQQLNTHSSEFSALISEAIDDLESCQIQALNHSPLHGGVLQLAIGFSDAAPIQLQIGREPQRDTDTPSAWVVNIHSHNEQWGELWLQTRILEQHEITMTMWTLREDVYKTALEHQHELALELRDGGLNLVDFKIVHGPRPLEMPVWLPPESGSLIDVEA